MYDGDLIFTTNNDVLIRKHRKLPAILCVQRNTEKVIPTEEDILKTNINAMGNKVGSITNRATSMMDKQSYFEKGTREYIDIQTRIEICQLEQQNEIDKIKGIVAKPMPEYWYMTEACEENDYLRNICTNKKPYFMMYIYSSFKTEHNKQLDIANGECWYSYHKSLKNVLEENKETEFIQRFYDLLPLSDGNCTMNRICHYIEGIFDDLKVHRPKKIDYDYSYLLYDVRCSKEHKAQLKELSESYRKDISGFSKIINKTKDDKQSKKSWLYRKYQKLGEMICPNEQERVNIVIGLGLDNGFLWHCLGDAFIKRLKELV